MCFKELTVFQPFLGIISETGGNDKDKTKKLEKSSITTVDSALGGSWVRGAGWRDRGKCEDCIQSC